MERKRKIISVEGNTGCGKSTFLKFFADYEADVEISPEPVDIWCDFHGYNFLQKRFENPGRWTFTFQSLVQLTRLEVFTKQTYKKYHVIERSLQSNRYCFVETAKKLGSLCDEEYALLVQWYDWLERNVDVSIDLIVYLRTTPEAALQRIHQRGRPEERGITLEFLQMIHNYYENWLMSGTPLGCPLIIIDANEDMDTLGATLKQQAAEIMKL